MSLHPLARKALMFALFCCANASAGLLRDDDPPAEPREESAVVLPAAPKKVDLLRYEVSATSSMNFALPRTAPPSTRPWPSMYFVAEWMTTSAPCSSGR